MLKLPEWANDFMKNKECPYCHSNMAYSTIVHLGIKLHKEEKPCLYFESKCRKCDNMAHTTIFTDVELTASSLASEIFHAIDSSDSDKTNDENGKNSFEKDFDRLKDFLKKEDQYVEFLKFIGLTDNEIEEYAIKTKEDE